MNISHVPLSHRILIILVAAATKGKTRMPITAYYDIFAELIGQFPNVFPDIAVIIRTHYGAYSKPLDSALQSLVCYSVDINLKLQCYEISEDSGNRQIVSLREKYSPAFIDSLMPVVAVFMEELDKH